MLAGQEHHEEPGDDPGVMIQGERILCNGFC